MSYGAQIAMLKEQISDLRDTRVQLGGTYDALLHRYNDINQTTIENAITALESGGDVNLSSLGAQIASAEAALDTIKRTTIPGLQQTDETNRLTIIGLRGQDNESFISGLYNTVTNLAIDIQKLDDRYARLYVLDSNYLETVDPPLVSPYAATDYTFSATSRALYNVYNDDGSGTFDNE